MHASALKSAQEYQRTKVVRVFTVRTFHCHRPGLRGSAAQLCKRWMDVLLTVPNLVMRAGSVTGCAAVQFVKMSSEDEDENDHEDEDVN